MADRLIKYMGTSHVHTLEKGETFDGRYPDGLPNDLVFNQDNKWVVNVGDLPDDAADLISEDPSFKDVTDMKRVPDNEHQKIFHPRGGNVVSEPNALLSESDGEAVTTSSATDAGAAPAGDTSTTSSTTDAGATPSGGRGRGSRST